MNLKKTIITFISVLAGVIVMFVFNYGFLENYIIPDPCYYHDHKPSGLMRFFYEFTSSENYHPFPSAFNLCFTAVVGGLVGFFFSRLAFRIFPSRETVLDQ
jgi:hypothetical protein